jgi:hypothetical protein
VRVGFHCCRKPNICAPRDERFDRRG